MLPAADLSNNSSAAQKMASCKIADEDNDNGIKPTMLQNGENSVEECCRPASQNGNVTTTMNEAIANGEAQKKADEIVDTNEKDESCFKTPALPSKKLAIRAITFNSIMFANAPPPPNPPPQPPQPPQSPPSDTETSSDDGTYVIIGQRNNVHTLRQLLHHISHTFNVGVPVLTLQSDGSRRRGPLVIYSAIVQQPLDIDIGQGHNHLETIVNMGWPHCVDIDQPVENAVQEAENQSRQRRDHNNFFYQRHRRRQRDFARIANRDGTVIHFVAIFASGFSMSVSWQP